MSNLGLSGPAAPSEAVSPSAGPVAGGGGPRRRRIALVGGLHVGVETVFRNVQQAAYQDLQVDVISLPIASFRLDPIERLLPFLPKSTRGNLRYIAGTRLLPKSRDLRVVWSLLDIPLLPWMLTRNRHGDVPVIFSTDSTPRQLRAFGPYYGHWGGRSDVKFRLREALYRSFINRTAVVHVYTEWAARSFRHDYGIAAEKIRTFPPGVDPEFWSPPKLRPTSLPRVIFVGGDFIRKGGDLLLDVFRQRLRGKAELDIVTRPGELTPEPGVRIHSGFKPNDPRLVRLYQRADILAIPTRADCFSIAAIEGMATSLPVVTCPVGGVGEVFTESVEGFFVPPDDAPALARALEALVSNSALRRRMGAAGRELVLERYTAQINTRRLLNLVDEVNNHGPGDPELAMQGAPRLGLT